MRCEMYTTAMPSRRSRAMFSNSNSASRSVSEAVGSSRMSTRQVPARPRAISTICCSPTPSAPTGVRGSMPVRPTVAMAARAAASSAVRRTKPKRDGSASRKMFSATDSVETRFNSCMTKRMPSRSAAMRDGGA